MTIKDWCTISVLTMFLCEGFALALFPDQVKALLLEAEPRMLQTAGFVESVLAVGLITSVLMG